MKVVIVGAGPRGTSVFERLIAQYADLYADVLESARPALEIALVDPFEPGAGHVWRRGQSRLYLMNTQSFFPTLIPDQGVSAPPLAGMSFNRWRELLHQNLKNDAGLVAEPGTFRLSPADRQELAELAATDFPSRALYGSYLAWCFAQLLRVLPEGVSVSVHASQAERIRSRGPLDGFDVTLANGTNLRADRVVLALGHLESKLSRAQQLLSESAASNGLMYLPPAVPADVDWSVVPAGECVLVRGMGLNFFDVLGQLTEGRGGEFVATGNPAGEALTYLPSGREPVIVGASRRGTPYRAKAALDAYYPASVTLRFLDAAAAENIRHMGATAGFEHDIWPLLHRDTLWAYYTTLARTQPSAIKSHDFLAELDSVLHSGLAGDSVGWSQRLQGLLMDQVEHTEILNLEALARPLTATLPSSSATHRFSSQASLDAAVLTYLKDDAASSAEGEDDPLKMAIGALNAGRAVVKELVVDGGITEESWMGELRGWFEGLVEGLASGPPALRMEQLAALVQAGIVHFTGPDPVFTVRDGLFEASSPWGEGQPWRAHTLIEALAPSNRVEATASPLLLSLLEESLVRPKIMIASDGGAVVSSGLDVSEPPYRPLDGVGEAVEGLYVLGLQLSSVQWGTAIAAQAQAQYPSGYRTVQDADKIAADILG